MNLKTFFLSCMTLSCCFFGIIGGAFDAHAQTITPNQNATQDYHRLQLDHSLPTLKKGDEADPLRIPIHGEGNYDPIIKRNIIKDVIDTGPTGTQYTARKIFQRSEDGRSPVTVINVIVGVVAFVFLIYIAILFFFADGDPQSLTTARKYLAYVALGLAIVSLAEFAAFQLLDPSTEGAEPRLTSDTTAKALGMKIDQIIDYIEIFITGVMLLLMGLSGYSMITSNDTEEVVTNERKFLTSFLVGGALILLSEVITLVFSDRSPQDAIFRGGNQVVGIINYALTFLGFMSFAMLVLAGFYYVTSFGKDDQMERAKKIILGSVLGIVVAISSYTVVQFMIK